MNKTQISQLKRLVECAEYARGTDEFEKHVLTLLTYLSGLLSNFEQ